MIKLLQKLLMPVFLAVFLFSTAMLLRQWKNNSSGESAYEDAMKIALQSTETRLPEQNSLPTVPAATEAEASAVTYWVPVLVEDDPAMEEMEEIDIAALKEVNPDVLGWIRIPDTKIDYPLMQGEDNEFYLNHTWEKTVNSVGSIFLEHLNDPALTDYNTIVYGHNMGDGSMFAGLQSYAGQDFWETHPYVYIATEAAVYRYEVFAFYRAQVDSLTYGMDIQRSETREEFLTLSLESSWIDTGIHPELMDRILTLSTCSGMNYSNRYVVQARLPMVKVTK